MLWLYDVVTFYVKKHGEKKAEKSRKAFQADDSIGTSAAHVFLLLLTQQLFQCTPSLLRVWSKSRSQSFWEETC